jgi:UDP-N-acetylmuramoyl-tripeptide--D-alanyl-D-alanine ligase
VNNDPYNISVSYDSRTIRAGEYYVPFKGDVHDGNKFIDDAMTKGAAGIIEEDALYSLVKNKLNDYKTKIIGITGSAGKTTTKEYTYALLSKKYRTLRSPGNINTLIGLSVDIINNLDPEHEIYVAEMGMDRAGELRHTSSVITPEIAIYTIINEAHLEKLGSLQNIINAKSELLENMSSDSLVILNADNANVMSLRERIKGRSLTYSLRVNPFDFSKLRVFGDHNRSNILAASYAAISLGMSKTEIEQVYPELKAEQGRGSIENGVAGSTLIDDTYNANEASVKASLATLKELDGNKRIVFLGDMLELGTYEETAHKNVLDFIESDIKPDLFVTIGPRFAKAGAMRYKNFATSQEASKYARELITAGYIGNNDIVLVKGSRGIKTELVLNEFKKTDTINSTA